jgi:ClpP class serine protease
MPKERVRALADGRVYSGRMARELGLVDALGGLDDAISLAGELGGITGKPRVVRPRRAWRLVDLADWLGGGSALHWFGAVGPPSAALPALPLVGSPKLPLYLMD